MQINQRYTAFSQEQVERIASLNNCVYLLTTDVQTYDQDNELHQMNRPCAIFYQPNPDRSKGHSHYFGIYKSYSGNAFIFKACPASRVNFIVENGVYYHSSHRHDYVVTPEGNSIDGGIDYGHIGTNKGTDSFPEVISFTIEQIANRILEQ